MISKGGMCWGTPLTIINAKACQNEGVCLRIGYLNVPSAVSQSVDLGQNNNPNTTPTKDYENVRVVVYLHGVQRGCAEEGERGSTPTG